MKMPGLELLVHGLSSVLALLLAASLLSFSRLLRNSVFSRSVMLLYGGSAMLVVRVAVALIADATGLSLMVYMDAATMVVFVLGVIHLKQKVSAILVSASDPEMIKYFNLQEAVEG